MKVEEEDARAPGTQRMIYIVTLHLKLEYGKRHMV